MIKTTLLGLAAVVALAALPAYGQAVKPDPSQPGGYPLKPGGPTALIQEKCVVCHDLRRVVNSNKDAEEWPETIHMMKAAGALIDEAQEKRSRTTSLRTISDWSGRSRW